MLYLSRLLEMYIHLMLLLCHLCRLGNLKNPPLERMYYSNNLFLRLPPNLRRHLRRHMKIKFHFDLAPGPYHFRLRHSRFLPHH